MRTNIIVAVLVLGLMCGHAAAQLPTRSPGGQPWTPVRVLTSLCVHEASLPYGLDEDEDGTVDRWVQQRDHGVLWGDDCYLLHQVLLRGAERMRQAGTALSFAQRYLAFALAYSHGRLMEPSPGDINAWTMYVGDAPFSATPLHWRGSVPWHHAVRAWTHAWRLASGIARMTLDDFAPGPTALYLCDEPITDWGGRIDHRHADAVGLIEVHCDGFTANTGYVRPALRE